MAEDEVRRAYAARADEYVAVLGSLRGMPGRDRELIASWSHGIAGPVLDAGCGPGHWTAFLHEQGLDVEGVDLVPEFIASAKRRFPGVPFVVGDLNHLPVPDAGLGAVLAWFSVIHTPPEQVPAHLAEFARCLRPGGSLLVGSFTGPTLAPFDHAVVTAWFWPPDAMRRALEEAGFAVLETHERPAPEWHRPYAALIAARELR